MAQAPLSAEQEFYADRYRDARIVEPLVDHVVPARCRPQWERLAGPLTGKQVLDVGAGTGRTSIWLASRGATATAVELSPEGCESIEQRARYHGLTERVNVVCADACRLPDVLAPESIDIAAGAIVLHHLPAVEFGAALRQVLKPGAHALFLENSDRNPLYRLGRRIRNDESPSGRPLSAADADAFIKQVGTGERVYPLFGLFRHIAKYVLTESRPFGRLMVGLDELIDHVPATRRWSAHMWVYARKT